MWRTEIKIAPSCVVLLGVFVLLSSGALLAALLLAALCHELGHYAWMRAYKVNVKSISITVFGAEMTLRGHVSYRGEIFITAAGILSNLFFTGVFAYLGRVWAVFYLLAGAQAVLGVFNLLPVRPLDGGRLLWLIVAYGTEPVTADTVCRTAAVFVSCLLTVLAALLLGRTGQGFFLLLASVFLFYRTVGEKGLVKQKKTR